MRDTRIGAAAFAAVTLAVFGLFLGSGMLLVLAGVCALFAIQPRRQGRIQRRGVVYHLIDPRTNAVRYVGQTIRHPSTRLREHCEEPQASVREWVDELHRA